MDTRPNAPQQPPLEIRIEGAFAEALARTGATLAFSAYQAGKLVLLDTDPAAGRLRLTPVGYRKPMGIATGAGLLAVATLDEVHVYADRPDLAENLGPPGRFARAFFPRLTWHCGPLDLHDLCFVGTELWAVNTLFSCICSFDAAASFTPRWAPPFVSALGPEDRCHLNGMALEGSEVRWATALGAGDTPRSWREDITRAGVLLSVPDGAIAAAGLSMPHSPRVAGGALYLLQSARGELSLVDAATGHAEPVVRLPGLVRGLCILGTTAFVGVSRARERSPTFHRLAETARVEHAAIHAIDLVSGRVLGTITFLSLVEEIYDIQSIPGSAGTAILGLYDARHRQAVWHPGQSFWKRTEPAPGDEAGRA